MNYGDFEAEDPKLFAEGKAFGEANLQRYHDQLKDVSRIGTDDVTEFIYPALAVEVLGMVELIRVATDREEAQLWFSQLLDFMSACMSKNPMKSRIESTEVVDADEEPEGEPF